jgi:hypothetical protein
LNPKAAVDALVAAAAEVRHQVVETRNPEP